jgi:hypothetical protein
MHSLDISCLLSSNSEFSGYSTCHNLTIHGILKITNVENADSMLMLKDLIGHSFLFPKSHAVKCEKCLKPTINNTTTTMKFAATLLALAGSATAFAPASTKVCYWFPDVIEMRMSCAYLLIVFETYLQQQQQQQQQYLTFRIGLFVCPCRDPPTRLFPSPSRACLDPLLRGRHLILWDLPIWDPMPPLLGSVRPNSRTAVLPCSPPLDTSYRALVSIFLECSPTMFPSNPSPR